MQPSPFGGLEQLIAPAITSSDATVCQTLVSTLLGVGIGYCIAQEQQSNHPPAPRANPYRNQTDLVTVLDLERWVMENKHLLADGDRVLRDLAQLPQQQRVTQQLVRDVLPPARR